MSRPGVRLLMVAGLVAGVASCGGSSGSDTAAPESTPAAATTEVVPAPDVAETIETTEPAPTTEVPESTQPPATNGPEVPEPLIVANQQTPITMPAVAVCEAIGEADTEAGLATLIALFAPEAVVTDAMTGATYHGTDEIAAYYASLAATFGIDGSTCGSAIQVDDWAAGSYEFLAAGAPINQGITAIHVTNGLVDQQVNHYTAGSGDPSRPLDSGTGVLAIGENYCQAWVDRDVETVTRLLTDNPTLHTELEIVGVDQAVAFMEALPYDIHTCGPIIKVGNWDATGTIMTDPATGSERAILHVLELDPSTSGKIAQHWFYSD